MDGGMIMAGVCGVHARLRTASQVYAVGTELVVSQTARLHARKGAM